MKKKSTRRGSTKLDAIHLNITLARRQFVGAAMAVRYKWGDPGERALTARKLRDCAVLCLVTAQDIEDYKSTH